MTELVSVFWSCRSKALYLLKVSQKGFNHSSLSFLLPRKPGYYSKEFLLQKWKVVTERKENTLKYMSTGWTAVEDSKDQDFTKRVQVLPMCS